MLRKCLKQLELLVAGIFYITGITRVIIWWNQKRGMIPILVYHSVREQSSPSVHTPSVCQIGMSIKPATFKKQLESILRYYQPVTLQNYLENRKSNQSCSKALVFTFDDGYQDNRDLAAPILESYGVRGTFFLVGMHIEGKDLSPLHRLYAHIDWMIEKGETEEARRMLGSPSRRKVITGGIEISEIVDRLIGSKLAAKPSDYFLPPEDARELIARGHEIGGHGYRHLFLCQLPDSELFQEAAICMQKIREVTGDSSSIGFAYPFGVAGSTTRREADAVRSAGFQYAVTTEERLCKRNDDSYLLPRIQMDDIPHFVALFRMTGLRGVFKTPVQRVLWRKRLQSGNSK